MTAPGKASGAGGERRRPSAAELTGEIPRFVADRLAHPSSGVDSAGLEDIESLVDLGLDRAVAIAAVRDERVPLVLAQQVLGEERTLTLEDVADRTGIPVDDILRLRGALGMPPREAYGQLEVEWASGIARLLELIPIEGVVRAARGRGQAMNSVAMNDLSVIRDALILPMRGAGADDLTVAVAMAQVMRSLLPVSMQLLELTYRMQLENLLGSEIAAIAATTSETELDIAVGFVDVVGYTALSSRIDPGGLESILDAFEDHVLDHVAAHAQVAVVKYLGDAAMLVAPTADHLADAMLDLVAPVEALEDAPLRGGMAAGPVLVREGDYFGAVVNMAARLTDIARPWSFLVAEDAVDRLSDAYVTRRIRPTRIRGFGLRRPATVTPAAQDDAE